MTTQPSFSLELVTLRMIKQVLWVYLPSVSSVQASALILPRVGVDTQQDKNIENSVRRHVREALGIDAAYIEQVKTIGNGTRFPQGWEVSVIYYILLSHEEMLSQEDWYPVGKLGSLNIAFDHAGVIASCVKRLRNKAQYTSLPLYLMGEEFTLTDLQKVYERLLETSLEKKSFRRRILDAGLLRCLDKERRGSNRPAQLYGVKSGHIIHHFSRNMIGNQREFI